MHRIDICQAVRLRIYSRLQYVLVWLLLAHWKLKYFFIYGTELSQIEIHAESTAVLKKMLVVLFFEFSLICISEDGFAWNIQDGEKLPNFSGFSAYFNRYYP